MELMIPRKEVEVFKDLFEKAFKAADPESAPLSSLSHDESLICSKLRDHGFLQAGGGGIVRY